MKLPTESPASIAGWSRQTFGDVAPEDILRRAELEMIELRHAVSGDPLRACDWCMAGEIAEEAADVVIVLCRLVGEYGRDLWEEVDRKMAVNRRRQWDGQRHITGTRDV